MTDREWDAVLRQGLILANSPERLNLPEEPFLTSETYERRMANMLKNPFKYAKKARRAARPVWQKVLSNVAMVLIVLSVSFASVMFVSPTARAFVQRVVIEWLEEYVGFHFTGTEVEVNDNWRLSVLPEGFKLVERDDNISGGYGYFVYRNEEGIEIIFSYRPVAEGNQFNIENENSEYQELNLNGRPAHLFISNTADMGNVLFWFNSDETVAFKLISTVDKDLIIQMAEGAEK